MTGETPNTEPSEGEQEAPYVVTYDLASMANEEIEAFANTLSMAEESNPDGWAASERRSDFINDMRHLVETDPDRVFDVCARLIDHANWGVRWMTMFPLPALTRAAIREGRFETPRGDDGSTYYLDSAVGMWTQLMQDSNFTVAVDAGDELYQATVAPDGLPGYVAASVVEDMILWQQQQRSRGDTSGP